MDKKSMRLLIWHLLPAAYLVVLSAGAALFLPIDQLGMLVALALVGVVWAGVSGGMLLGRLRRQRLAVSDKQG